MLKMKLFLNRPGFILPIILLLCSAAVHCPDGIASCQAENDKAFLETSLKNNPNSAESRLKLGDYYQQHGFDELAREQFAIAFSLDPTCSNKLLRSFEDKFKSGDPSSAFTDWMIVRSVFPDNKNVRLMQELVNRIYGSETEAQSRYLRLMANGSGLRQINVGLSMHESAYGSPLRAFRLAQNDARIRPTYANLLAGAVALNKLGRYEEARAILLSLYRINPLVEDTLEQLTVSSLRLGKIEAALSPSLLSVLAARLETKVGERRYLSASIIRRIPTDKLTVALESGRKVADKAGLRARFEAELKAALPDSAQRSAALNEGRDLAGRLKNYIRAGRMFSP